MNMVIARQEFEFVATVWPWQHSTGSKMSTWYFVTVEGETAAEIRLATLGMTAGFGSVRVRASIGATNWSTSIFPHRETGGWILPLKADVRKRAGIALGDEVFVTLEI